MSGGVGKQKLPAVGECCKDPIASIEVKLNKCRKGKPTHYFVCWTRQAWGIWYVRLEHEGCSISIFIFILIRSFWDKKRAPVIAVCKWKFPCCWWLLSLQHKGAKMKIQSKNWAHMQLKGIALSHVLFSIIVRLCQMINAGWNKCEDSFGCIESMEILCFNPWNPHLTPSWGILH